MASLEIWRAARVSPDGAVAPAAVA